jgi:hypothetical protein
VNEVGPPKPESRIPRSIVANPNESKVLPGMLASRGVRTPTSRKLKLFENKLDTLDTPDTPNFPDFQADTPDTPDGPD